MRTDAAQRSEHLISAAAQAQQRGQIDEVRRLAREALEMEPASIPAKFLLGMACARLGEPAVAAEMLSQVLEAEPDSYETLISLSNLYRESGRLEDAINLSGRALAIRPKEAHAYNHHGRCLLAARRAEQASAAFIRATELQPRFAPPFYNLGKLWQLEGKDGEAAQAFSRAAELAPTVENLLAFGQCLLTLCSYEDALTVALRCVGAFPASAAAHLLLCGALTELNRLDEAEQHLHVAIRLDKDSSEALQIGTRQRPLGYVEEANDNLRLAIERKPRLVSAYGLLLHNQRTTERDRGLVERLEALVSAGGLAPTEVVSANFGLGKAFEELGEPAKSMGYYDEANRVVRLLKLGEEPFDRSSYVEQVDRMISERFAGTGVDSELPVLIVGMIRSGTTLAEQILSSHPAVVGAGEQLFWSHNWQRDGIEAGEEYIALLESFGRGAARVTDKMPGNYMFLGPIHSALPNARIIHMRRNPADNCLSIWATPNHMPHAGGHDKGDIVFVYKQYLRLMEHWRTVLPPDRFMEVDYEALVADRKAVTRKMVAFCGLDWNDACLRPEENKRTVLTPSAWQVRQPVYKTSVERWRPFEPYLGEFRELLDI